MGCGLYLQPLMTMRTSSVKRKKRNKTKLVSNLQQKGDRPQLQHAAYEKKENAVLKSSFQSKTKLKIFLKT